MLAPLRTQRPIVLIALRPSLNPFGDACFATHSDAECLAVLQAKQTAMEELTQGQAMTMVRNQQIIDKSAEEMDDLEEMLNESIADSMRSAKEKASGQSGKKKKRCASLIAQDGELLKATASLCCYSCTYMGTADMHVA